MEGFSCFWILLPLAWIGVATITGLIWFVTSAMILHIKNGGKLFNATDS